MTETVQRDESIYQSWKPHYSDCGNFRCEVIFICKNNMVSSSQLNLIDNCLDRTLLFSLLACVFLLVFIFSKDFNFSFFLTCYNTEDRCNFNSITFSESNGFGTRGLDMHPLDLLVWGYPKASLFNRTPNNWRTQKKHIRRYAQHQLLGDSLYFYWSYWF